MFNIVRRQLLQGVSLVCDSPLGYRRSYDRAVRIAEEAGAQIAVVECVCSDEAEWRRRIESRQAVQLPSHHTTDWSAVQTFLRRTAADAEYAIEHPHLVLDTAASPARGLCETEEIMRTPFSGTGKPEVLRYIEPNVWSRRITQEHRLVYMLRGDRVDFLQCRYHY